MLREAAGVTVRAPTGLETLLWLGLLRAHGDQMFPEARITGGTGQATAVPKKAWASGSG